MAESGSECSAIKGIAAGLVAGFVASWVMSQFQTAVGAVGEALNESERETGGKSGGEVAKKPQQEEPATVKAAEALTWKLWHRQLSDSQKKIAGPAMHYAMGITTGAIYGAMCEAEPVAKTGGGLLLRLSGG